MREHLEAYCTINTIDDADMLISAGDMILHHDEKHLLSLARKGYILAGFYQLVRGHIDLEQFINNGEVLDETLMVTRSFSANIEQSHWRYAPQYIAYMFLLDDMWGSHTLFLLEETVWNTYTQQSLLEAAIHERESVLVLI